MKTNEVPQDPKNFREGDKVNKLLYAVDKDGNYTGVTSAGWEAENFATKQAWDAVDEELAHTAEQVKRGALSPIAYYMHKCLMEPSLLAKYVGKWTWQVKRHMKKENFEKLSADMLARYAKAFNISVEELTSFGK
ncbi:MAG: hypothetical protein JST70_09045 [Bacteroidetes bacterium]|nr:hypothetical protein [Bacteroidota bacterium]